MPMSSQKNVLGGELQPCSFDPLTGWTRNGCCETDASDRGVHTVCIIVTDEFLQFSRAVGNDLSTPRPEYGFGGLRSEEHTSDLQSLMRISYAVFCLNKKNKKKDNNLTQS